MNVLRDIRFWICFFFILRLYAITNPPLEVGHNWRQTDGLMIARNFYEHSANIFYPAVDVSKETDGIVGSEFPILNYIIYLVSIVFGFHHWYGRLVVLLSSCVGVYFFYRIVRDYFTETAAFNSAMLLMVSFWFSYSRKIIPDVFSNSLCIVGLYFALTFLRRGDWWRVLLFFALAALGCLSKILAAAVLTVLAFPLFDPSIPLSRKVVLSVLSSIILLLVCSWYFWWVPHLNSLNGLDKHFFMGYSFQDGTKQLLEKLPAVLKRFYDTPMKFTGFAAFLFAIGMVVRNKQWIVLEIFVLPFLAFLIMLLRTGSSIVGDTYYVITMIVPMAFITGVGLSYLKSLRIITFILVVVAVENIAAQIYDFRIREPWKSLSGLEAVMDQVSERDDKIVVSGQPEEPTVMYFAHRKGWVALNNNIQDTVYINEVSALGCKYALIVKKIYGDVNLDRPIVHDSENFRIYKLY